MTIPSATFGPAAIADLVARTEYEAWLLEAVYEISDQRIAVENVSELIFPPSGGPPTQIVYAAGHIRIGDWRPDFLEAGAPLVLVSGFKLLDMLIEWVLTKNGGKANYRFVEKIAKLKTGVQFPELIQSRPWLRDRLVALYEGLEPLRGTIIHGRHFTSTAGGIEVSSTKWGTIGPVVTISAKDLRSLALVLVSLVRYLEGTWAMDLFREKIIRHTLDELTHLHSLAPLRQFPPTLLNVRVYAIEGDSIQFDLDMIRKGVTARHPDADVMFDLRVVLIASDGSRATAYLIPWSELQDAPPQLTRLTVDLVHFTGAVLPNLDPLALARELIRC
jgi:hypothetical protein